MKASVLKPGLLVSLKTSIKGGVNYQRVDLEPEHDTAEGARIARWETTREVPDPTEFERAIKARSAARSVITATCCASSFGLLCPTTREADLDDAITEARKIADAHNAGAALSQVQVYVLVGRVASDDAEAARAIGAEVRELLDLMRAGIAAANPDAIREAAGKARALGSMLDESVAGRVTEAIVEARKAAREIVARVSKAGETAAQVVAECSVARIDAARFAFLDLDDGAEVTHEAPAARGLDLEPVGVPGAALSAQSYDLPFALEV